MGATTKIAWTDATISFWFGCTKVSPACDHCYAESWAKRSGMVEWGNRKPRRRSKSAVKTALKLNAEAAAAKIRKRVFTLSLGDFADTEVPDDWRDEAMDVIDATPWLDWLILTKRPHALATQMKAYGRKPNVWVGTTVENQAMADLRIPHLLEIDAEVHFISYEPALEAVDFHLTDDAYGVMFAPAGSRIDWIIAGGESGPHARRHEFEWDRSALRQCRAAGIAFFEKQAGALPTDHGHLLKLKDRAGADPSEWPADLRVQEFPR